MPSAIVKHKHIYIAVTPALKQYKCKVPNCRHIITPALLEGRTAMCGKCGADLEVTYEHLKRHNINCINCPGPIEIVEPQIEPEVPTVTATIENLLQKVLG